MATCRSAWAQYPLYTTLISGMNIGNNIGNKYFDGYRRSMQPPFAALVGNHLRMSGIKTKTKDETIQTVFRESETQTDPFAPDIKKPFQSGLEVFTLSWLSWNNHLPAGMREVIVIERARQKRAWQKALPPPFNTASTEIQNIVLEAIELNEWNFREIELAALSSIRLDLARKCMHDNLAANRLAYQNRVSNYLTVRSEQKKMALLKVRHQLKRNLRRLTYKHNHVNRRYHRWNVVRELEDKTSEHYGPQMRFGVHPERAHEIIPKQFRYWNVFSRGDILTMNTKLVTEHPKKNPGFDYANKSKPRQHFKQLCIRETRWTNHELQKLHDTVKLFTSKAKSKSPNRESCSLRQRIEHEYVLNATPAVTGVSDEEEENRQAAVTLQKIVKGRAIQAVMFEGRVRCQELIDELKSTHTLQKCMEEVRKDFRLAVYNRQRNAELKCLEEKRKNEILASLEGKTVADMLDFLSKELIRIRNERETHAIALMADRERHEKEAAEAGRRQKEIERSRELDEMWRQICKVYQNTLDSVSQDIIELVKKNFSEGQARMEATKYAKRIDEAAMEAHLRQNQLEEEEIVADLVYNFALPEAEKEMVRTRLNQKQKRLLSSCHDEIYSQIENVARGKRSSSGRLLPIPRTRRDRYSRMRSYVTYVELNKAGDSVNSCDEISGSTVCASLTEFQVADDVWSTGFTRKEVLIKDSQSEKFL